MKTFTTEEIAVFTEFIEKHSQDVRKSIIENGYALTEESIIELANHTAKRCFMDFPDYEESEPLELADSLVILYFDYVSPDIIFGKLYDYISINLKKTLCKITGAEN